MSNQTIKFVSYSGEWPTLCHGVLILEVNGKQMRFGYEVIDCPAKAEDKDNCPQFWKTGGGVTFDEEWNDFVWQGEWQWDDDVDDSRLPSEIVESKEQVMKIFNENVQHGCCGGCV